MAVKALRDFDIGIFKLKNGLHHYHFLVDEVFFECFENSPVKKARSEVELGLVKTDTFIKLSFDISGNIELTCDRSLKTFDHPVKLKKELILKFGEEDKELSDEISLISWNTEYINVAQFIFEFIGLATPMRKIHPELRDQINMEEDIIYSTVIEDDMKTEIDPRWSVLRNIKDNKKES